MLIGLDLDEVLCDLATHMCDYIKLEHDKEHDHDIFSSYNFYENDYTGSDVKNAKVADDLIVQVNKADWLGQALPISGIPKAVQTLKLMGHEIHILTARAEGEEDYTSRWLLKFQIPFDSVTHIGYGSCKGVVGKEMGLDVFVDDHTYNIEQMLEYTDADIYIVTRPWNVDYNNEKVTRINHVSALINKIKKIGEANG